MNKKEIIEKYKNLYEDIGIEEGYLSLEEYYRKNYDFDNWRPILSKIAKIEQKKIEPYIFDDNSANNSGIRAYPNGGVKSLANKLVEVN